jgi:hypothetical protein
MRKMMCLLGLHDWSSWITVKRGTVTAPSSRDPNRQRIIGEVLVQERTCRTCNFVEVQEQRIELT